jgi:hypothetical protein
VNPLLLSGIDYSVTSLSCTTVTDEGELIHYYYPPVNEYLSTYVLDESKKTKRN